MSYLKYGLYYLGSQCIRRNHLRPTRILARIPLFILLTSQYRYQFTKLNPFYDNYQLVALSLPYALLHKT